MPNTTIIVKTIRANSINPHSDMAGMLGAFGEQFAGAVPALLLVKVQVGVAEKVAARLIKPPLALMVTPVKV